MIRLKKTDDGYEVTVSVTKTIPKNMIKDLDGDGTRFDEEAPPDTTPVAEEIAKQLLALAKNAPDFDEVKMDKKGRMTCMDMEPEDEDG